jgi:hypothetical protein
MLDYATLLRDHITLTCRSIDRLFLQAYVPKLQSVGQVCLFLNRQRGFRIPSSAAFGQIGDAYVTAIHRWAQAERIPVRYFAKGENKEKIVEPLLRAAAEQGGEGKVVLIGIAQVRRTEGLRSDPRTDDGDQQQGSAYELSDCSPPPGEGR